MHAIRVGVRSYVVESETAFRLLQQAVAADASGDDTGRQKFISQALDAENRLRAALEQLEE